MDKKLKSALYILGAFAIIIAVILFVRFENRPTQVEAGEEAAEVPPLTVGVVDATPTPEPEPTPTEAPGYKESALLGLSPEELDDLYSHVVWDMEWQKEFVDSDTEEHDDPYYYQKLWLSMHPYASVKGYENIYYEPSTGELVDKTKYNALAPSYLNKVVTYDYGNGTITIGTDTPATADGIQLDMTCSEASAESPVGFYFLPEANPITYDYGPMDIKPASEYMDTYGYNFFIPGRYYESVIPARATDTLVGAVWRDEFGGLGGGHISDVIHTRAVDLTNGRLIALFKFTIDYVDDCYQITDVVPSDAVAEGNITQQERDAIVEDAMSYFTSIEEGPTITVPNADYAKETALVEKTPRTYFDQLYDADMNPVKQSDFSMVETYAVNMNINGIGVVTAYYGPLTQVSYKFGSSTAPGSDDKNLVMFAFDATMPFNKDTIMAENGFMV